MTDTVRDGRILLLRGVRHDHAIAIATLKQKAVNAGEDVVAIQTDTLSSYSLRNGYTDGVMIGRHVPIEEVLLCNLTVALSGNENDLSDSEDEWIVVNRDIKGRLALRTEEILLNGGYFTERVKEQTPRWISSYASIFEEGAYIESTRSIRIEDSRLVSLAKKLELLFSRLRRKRRS